MVRLKRISYLHFKNKIGITPLVDEITRLPSVSNRSGQPSIHQGAIIATKSKFVKISSSLLFQDQPFLDVTAKRKLLSNTKTEPSLLYYKRIDDGIPVGKTRVGLR